MKRIMWIEQKTNGIVGPARIAWVDVRDKGKRLECGDKIFRTLRGAGFKSNYYDIAARDQYWISGCRKDGMDALYSTDVEIDEDALTEYWLRIRNQPENLQVRRFRAQGKLR
jgi:hypothetical protein